MPAFVYLASQSPRRQELLGQMGVHFKTLLPESNNAKALGEQLHALELLEAMKPAESAVQYVQRVTQLKYQAARLRGQALGTAFVASAPVLCADTTVSLSGRVLGKPKDAQEAQEMIRALSGQTHRVYTSVMIGTHSRLRRLQRVGGQGGCLCHSRQSEQHDFIHQGELLGYHGSSRF